MKEAKEDVADRSRWTIKGIGEVEVRGSSPVMVWFSVVDQPDLPQRALPLREFFKKARRQR